MKDLADAGSEITRVLGLLAFLHPELPYRVDRQTLRRIAWEERPASLRFSQPIPVDQETLAPR